MRLTSAGIVMIATVFTQLGLPIETVALLTSIDALVGMAAAEQSNIITSVGLSLLRVSFETTVSTRCACQQGKLCIGRLHS